MRKGTGVGCVFDIQRFCLHDGPGLRTTVFLKGCPLRCRWCSNPESQRPGPEILYNRSRCMGCHSCVAACPKSLITPSDGGVSIRRDECDGCGRCEDACPTASLVRKGRAMTVEEVVRDVARDREFYTSSGGGATLSGGEPFSQGDFLYELLSAIREAGVSTAIETTAHADWSAMERCLPELDCVMVDVKHADSGAHAAWTGVGLETIFANLRNLASKHGNVTIRIPVIPGFNTDAHARDGLTGLAAELGLRVELLPYHILGEGKYAMLGRSYPGAAIAASEADTATERLLEHMRAHGVDVSVDT